MRGVGLALAAALGAGSAAGAQGWSGFAGDWALGNPAACELGRDTPDLAVRIRDGAMHFYESVCQMANPVELRGLPAVLFDMECTGEGDSWSYSALLMRDGDGALVMLTGTEIRILPPCEGPVTEPAPATE